MKQVVVLLLLVSSGYVSGAYSANVTSIDIVGLIKSVLPTLGSGITPLLNVNATAAEYLAKDNTKVLEFVQEIIGNVSDPLCSMLDTLLAVHSSSTMPGQGQTVTLPNLVSLITSGAFIDNADLVTSMALNVATYVAKLAAKISSSAYEAMIQAISDLIGSLIGSGSLQRALVAIRNAIVAATTSNSPVTVATIMTPELVKLQAAAMAKVIAAIKNLVKALRMVITEINFSLIDPAIGSRLPTTVSLLGNFNALADSARNSVTQAAKSLVIDATSAFSSVTSNPASWNNGNITNLTTFLANFTSLLQSDFTQSLDTGINFVKANVSATLTSQVQQVAVAFDRVYTNISAVSVKSSSSFKASCVANYNASMLSLPATLSRLSNCVQLEADALGVINGHATETLRKVKDDAVKSMNQLRLCRQQSGPCAKKIFASFGIRYQSAVADLKLISDYTTSDLQQLITGRIADCTAALSAEIASEAQTLQVNFNRCLVIGY